MYFTYILFSSSKRRYYIGCTNDLAGRIRRHNCLHRGYTGNNDDWVLVWQKKFENKNLALSEERKIKNWKSRLMIEKLISEE